MSATPAPSSALDRRLHALWLWLGGWWQVVRMGSRLLVLGLSPSSYRRVQRGALLRTLYLSTAPLLPGFTLLAAVVALVVIRIVLATALSYGLSRYALNVLIHTLVLELIPLSAALFVAVRHSIAAGDAVRARHASGELQDMLQRGLDPLRDVVLPQALEGIFAVLALAMVSAAVTLGLAYLSTYGFVTWGLQPFTRTVGQVFSPVIALIFVLKTFFLSLAVSIVPMVTTPREQAGLATRSPADLTRLARLLAVILLIEVSSLVGNYY